jgi:hypothetical protein
MVPLVPVNINVNIEILATNIYRVKAVYSSTTHQPIILPLEQLIVNSHEEGLPKHGTTAFHSLYPKMQSMHATLCMN